MRWCYAVCSFKMQLCYHVHGCISHFTPMEAERSVWLIVKKDFRPFMFVTLLYRSVCVYFNTRLKNIQHCFKCV